MLVIAFNAINERNDGPQVYYIGDKAAKPARELQYG